MGRGASARKRRAAWLGLGSVVRVRVSSQEKGEGRACSAAIGPRSSWRCATPGSAVTGAVAVTSRRSSGARCSSACSSGSVALSAA
eukprot:scaffold44305_cov48-Phaeocystis_antarctica.AAC.1